MFFSAIQYSKQIHSDSALLVLQRIFIEKNKLTVWEKTSLLCGYYIVYYLDGEHEFSSTAEFLKETLNQELGFVKHITISDLSSRSQKFRDEFDGFLHQKIEEEESDRAIVLLYSQYPLQTEMKISLFGLKQIVITTQKQIKFLINKHRMNIVKLALPSTQVTRFIHILNKCVTDSSSMNIS